MRVFERAGGVPSDVLARAALPAGEKMLAYAPAEDGSWVLGTRRLLVAVGADNVTHLLWEEVQDASWDQETSLLQVTQIGTYGDQRPAYCFAMDDPARLLQLVRERVTASIVLQRRVPVRGKQGLTIIGRRSPVGGPITWMHAYDQGLEPDDPEVMAVADRALVDARAEVGDA